MKAYSYIRFSTPEQLKGDSLRRQLEAGEKYAKEHGLILDTDLSMQDLGLSAYHGVHKTKGKLGQFLKLVEEGKIEKGSVLIVENLDRLSRENVLDALNQFTGIIKAGISIVTLQDGQKYDVKSIDGNWAQLIISITYMARANEESKAKSKRLKAVWVNKRKAVKTDKKVVICTNLPYWLKRVDDKFVLIPEVCKAIETIYRMKAAGKSSHRIEKEINQMDDVWKPPISKRNESGGWNKSYINRLLQNNRTLIGEVQPHKLVDGKMVPTDEPVTGYYPTVIDEALFYRVQRIIKENSQLSSNGGGNITTGANLFVGIVKCGLCGGVMHFINKSNYKYLHCDRSRRKINPNPCHAKPVHYLEVEKAFFKDFDEFDISAFVPDKDKKLAEINQLSKQIEANQFRISDNERRRQNLLEAMASEDDKAERLIYQNSRSALKEENQILAAENERLKHSLDELRRNGRELKAGIDNAAQIYQLLNDPSLSPDEIIDNRLRLRQQIKGMVSEMVIHPLKEPYDPLKEIETGLVRWMKSKRIERVTIKFKGLKKIRVLQFAGYSELL